LPVLHSRVSSELAALVIGISLLALLVPVMIIRARTDSRPTITIPEERITEFETRRRELADAATLLDTGHFAESLQQYEAYLQKYPYSLAAADGRDRARDAIERGKQSTVRPARRRTVTKPKDEDISPREMLDRIKKVFRP
jgi:hypothetical protein